MLYTPGLGLYTRANLIQNSGLFVVKSHLLFLIITRRAAFLSQFLPSRSIILERPLLMSPCFSHGQILLEGFLNFLASISIQQKCKSPCVCVCECCCIALISKITC
uniref:Uncharacterized protein n=1 Tax=Salix viminalis TaxID=40686 RepID=A0A6N2M7X6_SALVM